MPKQVAVIGAGCSGLAATKACLEEKMEVICFEMTDKVAGLWNYTEEDSSGRATVFKGVVSNSSRECLCFSDFPQPIEHPTFMPHEVVANYYRLYTEHFNLMPYIRFMHKVISVKPTHDHEFSGRWSVKVKDLKTNKDEGHIFDAVLVCSGHHAFPKLPNFPGQDIFKGIQIHANQYRGPEQFSGLNVLVVGCGNSGSDIAYECSQHTKSLNLSTRRDGVWVLPRTTLTGQAVDCVFNRRYKYIVHALQPASWTNKEYMALCQSNFNHDHVGLRPSHSVLSQYPLINDAMHLNIINGKIRFQKSISHFTENYVVFHGSNETTPVDAVIYATGYRRYFPYLEGVVDAEKEIDTFYKLIFPSKLTKNTLAFIGLIDPDISLINSSEMQSRWVASILAGKSILPTPNMMTKEAKDRIDKNLELFGENFRIDLFVPSFDYVEDLASLIGVRPNFYTMLLSDPKLWWACITNPVLPQQYRLTGPHSWVGARDVIMSYEKRLGSHIKNRKSVNSKYGFPNAYATILLLGAIAALCAYDKFYGCKMFN